MRDNGPKRLPGGGETGRLAHRYRVSQSRNVIFFNPSAEDAARLTVEAPCPNWGRKWKTARDVVSIYLRCIFGNPFRPVAFDPGWRTEAAAGLAAGIYADRAFDRLPVLADALEDAGCGDPAVLAHCRGPGPHARGCWVLDLLLGKT